MTYFYLCASSILFFIISYFEYDYSMSLMLRQHFLTINKFSLQSGSVIPMPVPSSYNDITTDSKLRDFIGWVWYETDFFVSRDWQTNKRVVLRFGSAHYNTIVVSTCT